MTEQFDFILQGCSGTAPWVTIATAKAFIPSTINCPFAVDMIAPTYHVSSVNDRFRIKLQSTNTTMYYNITNQLNITSQGVHDHNFTEDAAGHINVYTSATHTHIFDDPQHYHDIIQDLHELDLTDETHIHAATPALVDSYPTDIIVKVNDQEVLTDVGGEAKTLSVDITSYLQEGTNKFEVYSTQPGAVRLYGDYYYYGAAT